MVGNEGGTVMTQVTLKVHDRRPSISYPQPQHTPQQPLQYTTAALGTAAELRCEADGNPKPVIQWTREQGGLLPR